MWKMTILLMKMRSITHSRNEQIVLKPLETHLLLYNRCVFYYLEYLIVRSDSRRS